MGRKKKKKKRKPFSQPYDKKLFAECGKCSGKMLYRKKKMFTEEIYYTICNNCGNYNTIPQEKFKEKIAEVSN